jgi:hypothetical protein
MSIKGMKPTLAICILTLSLSGCMSLGPSRMTADRVDYIQDLSESWKKQMLLNIVKLRYLDPPTFLDVVSIISQYGMENQVNADYRWYSIVPGNNGGVGGYSKFSDKPTITFMPLSGQKFIKNLLTPIPPAAVVSLIQSGWPIDMIFSLSVKTVNGVNNSGVEQPDFIRLLQALRTLQLAGATDIRLDKVKNKEAVVLVISDVAVKERFRNETETIRSVLKVKPGISTYRVVFGTLARRNDEIALLTRSMLEIMLDMASTINVPEQHVAEKRVKPTVQYSGLDWMQTRIFSGSEKPQDAFTAIRYQDHWFWIDNTDINAKRNFALLMIFLSLTETDQKAAPPGITIGG